MEILTDAPNEALLSKADEILNKLQALEYILQEQHAASLRELAELKTTLYMLDTRMYVAVRDAITKSDI